MVDKKQRLLRPRFTLGALLLLVTLLAIPLAYIGQRRVWNLKRKAALEVLLSKGATLWPEIPSQWEAMPQRPGLRPAKIPPAPVTGIQKWWNAILLEESTPPIKMVTYAEYSWKEKTPLLTDADLQLLAHFPEIEDFQTMGGEQITDEGLRVLSKLPNLRHIHLGGLPLAEGDFLRDWPKTSALGGMFFNGMKKLQGQHLAHLSDVSALKGITIWGCPMLTDESLRGVELAPQIESINLRGCELGDETIERWLSGRQLKSLTLGAKITRKSAAVIGTQHRLEWLQLFNAPLVDEDLAFLAHCENLKSLSIESMPVRGQFLEKVARPEKIEVLELSTTLFEDAYLPQLNRFTMLAGVSLNYTPITGEGFANCAPFPNGCRIGLCSTQLTDKGKSALAAIRFREGPNSASNVVSLPSNWTAEDFQRFAGGKAPWTVEVDIASARELRLATGQFFQVYGRAARAAYDNCPAKEMAAVIRLRQLADALVYEEEAKLREAYFKMKTAPIAAAAAEKKEP